MCTLVILALDIAIGQSHCVSCVHVYNVEVIVYTCPVSRFLSQTCDFSATNLAILSLDMAIGQSHCVSYVHLYIEEVIVYTCPGSCPRHVSSVQPTWQSCP